MIVTLDELCRNCRNALSAAGAPAGVDEEAALAAVWLEARGLAALDSVVAALDRWAGEDGAAVLEERRSENAARCFEAGGRSAVYLAGIAAGLAAVQEAVPLIVRTLSDPWFLLPAAVLDGGRDRPWLLSWPSGGAAIDTAGGVSLFGDWSGGAPRRPCEAILCRGAAADPDRALTLGPAELAARRDRNLASGLAVDPELWRRLAAYAARYLVPSSPESEARGAGSSTSDNE